MLIALPLSIIIIGVALFIAVLMVGVSIIAAAGGSRGAYGRHLMGTPATDADMAVWAPDTPPSDLHGTHQGHYGVPHHHHEPFNPGHTTSSHGDFGGHSSAGHGGFDGDSHGGGGHSGHF